MQVLSRRRIRIPYLKRLDQGVEEELIIITGKVMRYC
jgi:hypothetical protein